MYDVSIKIWNLYRNNYLDGWATRVSFYIPTLSLKTWLCGLCPCMGSSLSAPGTIAHGQLAQDYNHPNYRHVDKAPWTAAMRSRSPLIRTPLIRAPDPGSHMAVNHGDLIRVAP